jgi:hypothetical protein
MRWVLFLAVIFVFSPTISHAEFLYLRCVNKEIGGKIWYFEIDTAHNTIVESSVPKAKADNVTINDLYIKFRLEAFTPGGWYFITINRVNGKMGWSINSPPLSEDMETCEKVLPKF